MHPDPALHCPCTQTTLDLSQSTFTQSPICGDDEEEVLSTAGLEVRALNWTYFINVITVRTPSERSPSLRTCELLHATIAIIVIAEECVIAIRVLCAPFLAA